MSQKGNEAYGPAQDAQENDSVYDFLYHDVRRIGAFLAQFDDAGLLQQVTQSEGAYRGVRRGWKASAGGSLPGLGSANLSLERGPEKGAFEASDRVYDPSWANALTLLDFLEERNFFTRSLDQARIGQFVLITGRLSIVDFKLLRSIWRFLTVRQTLLQAFNDSERFNQATCASTKAIDSETKSNVDSILSFIGILPHFVQARISLSDGGTVWASLVEGGLVLSAADIVLKHGTVVAGEWTTLGVLDALPDIDDTGTLTDSGKQSALLSLAEDRSGFGCLMSQMMPYIRPLWGRPFGAHGITPLLIFRIIAGPSGSVSSRANFAKHAEGSETLKRSA
jgi:hypothetical protein